MLTKRKLLKKIKRLEDILENRSLGMNTFENIKDFFDEEYDKENYGHSLFDLHWNSRGTTKLDMLLGYLGIEFFTEETKEKTIKGYRKIKKTNKK